MLESNFKLWLEYEEIQSLLRELFLFESINESNYEQASFRNNINNEIFKGMTQILFNNTSSEKINRDPVIENKMREFDWVNQIVRTARTIAKGYAEHNLEELITDVISNLFSKNITRGPVRDEVGFFQRNGPLYKLPDGHAHEIKETDSPKVKEKKELFFKEPINYFVSEITFEIKRIVQREANHKEVLTRKGPMLSLSEPEQLGRVEKEGGDPKRPSQVNPSSRDEDEYKGDQEGGGQSDPVESEYLKKITTYLHEKASSGVHIDKQYRLGLSAIVAKDIMSGLGLPELLRKHANLKKRDDSPINADYMNKIMLDVKDAIIHVFPKHIARRAYGAMPPSYKAEITQKEPDFLEELMSNDDDED